MYKYILESAGDINWMAVFSLATFMFVFLTSVVLIFRKNNTHIKHMAQLPLQEDMASYIEENIENVQSTSNHSE